MSSRGGDTSDAELGENRAKPSGIFKKIIENTTASDVFPAVTGPSPLNIDNPVVNVKKPSEMLVGMEDSIFRNTGVKKPQVPMRYDPIGPFGVDPDDDIIPSINASQFNPIDPFNDNEPFGSIGLDESLSTNFPNRLGSNPRNPSMGSPNYPGGFGRFPSSSGSHFPF